MMARRAHPRHGVSIGLLLLFWASGVQAQCMEIYAEWKGKDGDTYSNRSDWVAVKNWDPLKDGEPNNTPARCFTVELPENKGVVLVKANTTVNALYLYNKTTLKVLTGSTYNVGKNAYIWGMVWGNGGDFDASAGLLGETAQLRVDGGGRVKILASDYSPTQLAGTYTLLSSDNGSLLDLSALKEMKDGFADTSSSVAKHTILAQNQGVIDLSALTKITGPAGNENLVVQMASGGSIRLGKLATIGHAGNLGYTSFVLDGSVQLDLPSLSSADSVTFAMTKGAKLNAATAPLVYSAAGLSGSYALMSSDGGSILKLSALTELRDDFAYPSLGSAAHTIVAQNHGVIDLSNLTTLLTPRDDEHLDISASSGGSILLSRLKSISAPTPKELGYVQFRLDGNDVKIELPALSSIEATQFHVTNGASLHAAGGPFVYSAATFNAGFWDYELLSANGVGSLLDLSAMKELKDDFSDGYAYVAKHTIVAQNQGVVDLSGLTALTGPKSNEELHVTAKNKGIVRLNALTTIAPSADSAGKSGSANFDVADGGTVILGDVDIGTTTTFQIGGASTVQAKGLRTAKTATILLSGGSTLETTDLPLQTGGTISLQVGSTLRAKGLRIAQAATITLSGGSTLDTLGLPLQTAEVTTISLQGGSTLRTASLQAAKQTTITLTGPQDRLVVEGDLDLGGTIALANPGQAPLVLPGDFSHARQDEAKVQLAATSVYLIGAGPQEIEVGGEDVNAVKLASGNFGFGQMVVGESSRPTVAFLVDHVDNGNRRGLPEALYLFGNVSDPCDPNGLRIEKGSIVYMGGLKVYALRRSEMKDLSTLFGPADVVIQFDHRGGYLHRGSPDVNDCRNLVRNGDFESGLTPPTSLFRPLGTGAADVAAWEIVKNMVTWTHESWFSDDGPGQRFVELASMRDGKGAIRQEIQTPEPGVYHVWFDVALNPYGSPAGGHVTVSASKGSTVPDEEVFPVPPSSPLGPMPTMGKPWPVPWRTKTWHFRAQKEKTTLTFESGEDGGTLFGPVIDNVIVLSAGLNYPPDCLTLKAWFLSERPALDPGENATQEGNPTLRFVFSKPVHGTNTDIAIRGPAGEMVPSFSHWENDSNTVGVTFPGPLANDGRYTVTLKNTIFGPLGEPLNGGKKDKIVFFTVDTKAPVLIPFFLSTSATSPELTGKMNDPHATVTVSLRSPGEIYTAQYNGKDGWRLPAGTIQPPLSPGAYDVTVTAKDQAGNSCTVHCDLIINDP